MLDSDSSTRIAVPSLTCYPSAKCNKSGIVEKLLSENKYYILLTALPLPQNYPEISTIGVISNNLSVAIQGP